MSSQFVRVLVGLCIAVFAGTLRAQPAAQEPPVKIGRIFIIGNDITQECVVLKAMGLNPGQTVHYAEIRNAEKSLERLGIFKIDRKNRASPTVRVINPDDGMEFHDILVEVEETCTLRLKLEAGINLQGQPAIAVVIEEGNFDALRFPTSLDDITRGAAFRGAGAKLRLELIQIKPLSRQVALLRLGQSFLPTVASFNLSGWTKLLAD